jgi:hypothetical protein
MSETSANDPASGAVEDPRADDASVDPDPDAAAKADQDQDGDRSERLAEDDPNRSW